MMKIIRKEVRQMEDTRGTGLLSPGKVAQILGLSKPHVYTLAKSGELPSIKFGRAVRFEESAVEAFIREHRRGKGKAA
jgi:excisionase family DNA binding protein